jgi:hypothetical protein
MRGLARDLIDASAQSVSPPADRAISGWLQCRQAPWGAILSGWGLSVPVCPELAATCVTRHKQRFEC